MLMNGTGSVISMAVSKKPINRALNHAWETMKDVIKDPANNLDAVVKIFNTLMINQWDAVDAVAENVWKNENKGAFLYQFADMNDSFARSPVSRYNSILMSGADGYTQTVMSTDRTHPGIPRPHQGW